MILPQTRKGNFQKTFVPVKVAGIAQPLNIKWYYRIHCYEQGCKKQKDAGYYSPLPEFVARALAEGWRYSEAGNFLCPLHAKGNNDHTTPKQDAPGRRAR